MEQVRLDPPTFEELQRYVCCAMDVDDCPRLYHATEASFYITPLTCQEDLDHAARITKPDRFLTVMVELHKKNPTNLCCCCGRYDQPKLPKADKKDKVLIYNNAPPGLRSRLCPPVSSFVHWNERLTYGEKEKEKKKFEPMLKAFM